MLVGIIQDREEVSVTSAAVAHFEDIDGLWDRWGSPAADELEGTLRPGDPTPTSEASIAGDHMSANLDGRDRSIIEERVAALNQRRGPRVGDFVIFADGAERRISEIWGVPGDLRIQTSDLTGLFSGRFYLSPSGCSFSGGLHPAIRSDTLTDTGGTRNGSVWIFHHNQRRAHNGVEAEIPFRVFRCCDALP